MTLSETPRRPVSAEDRESMPTVAEYLRADSRPVPGVLLERSTSEDLSVASVSKEAFTSREYAEREQRLLWNRVWQMACREAEVAKPGDFHEHVFGTQSVIVVRQPDGGLRAFHNVCQHRGTRLIEGSGAVGSAGAFTCSFHGWSWNTDGSLRSVPCRWDFPQVSDDSHRLPEVSCGTWNGFVFINADPHAQPLADFLGETLPRHFQQWPLSRRFKAVHVGKMLPCNWKIALEAFLEVYHTVRTHPEVLPYAADANAQYDQYGLHARFINAMGTPSPHLGEVDQQEVLDAMIRDGLLEVHDTDTGHDDDGAALTVDEGELARTVLADWMRGSLPNRTGRDYSQASDAELIDVIQYFCFPNLIPWGGHSFPLGYRALPGPDPDTCRWEVMIFSDYPDGDPPPDAPMRMTPPDEPWAALPELGGVGPILDQDVRNMRRLQLGLKSEGFSAVTFSRYQEATLRRYHQNLESYTGPVNPEGR
jgi:phenylpropionate dioxygenase-like ring-hydroxylating dioxygenase large terminal subunit